MFKRLLESIQYWAAVIFLIYSLLYNLIIKNSWDIKNILNTDWQNAICIFLALLSLTLMKIKRIRKFVFYILLKVKYFKIDYTFRVTVKLEEEISSQDIADKFYSYIEKSKKYKQAIYDLNQNNRHEYKAFIRNMGANIIIKNLDSILGRTNCNNWIIELNGINSYREMEEIVGFILNGFLELSKNEILNSINQIFLVIKKHNIEINFIDKAILFDIKQYELKSYIFHIESEEDINITVDNQMGISLSCLNLGDFKIGLETIKGIMIS